MPLPSIPNVRVVVRLPENRPAVPLNDPPKIEWTSDKADILWKVIEKSRTSDNGGTDWKGLAAHLEVPLPYLLYRAHARFQEDLRGLQDVAITSPTSGIQPSMGTFDNSEEQPVYLKRTSKLGGSTGSSRTTIRARLNSLGSHHNQTHPQNQNPNHTLQKKTTTSSSTLTLQGPAHKPRATTQNKTPITSDDETSDSEDEEMLREEEADRHAEEQEILDRKLLELQQMMTSEALGLVAPRKRRGASRPFSPRSSASASASASGSSASASISSPQGSIPEIPTGSGSSPSQSYSSPRQLKSPSSPPALSPRSALGQRYGRLVGRSNSEQESVNGSEASSFSDISDASLSGSALESALLSNIRGGGGSRFSNFTRSRFGGGRSAIPH